MRAWDGNPVRETERQSSLPRHAGLTIKKRYHVRVLAVCLVLICLVGLAGAINPFYHDRQALSAFHEFRSNPTPETEAAWIASRDRQMRREMTLRLLFLGLALGAGIGAVVSWKKSGQRKPAEDAPKKDERKGLGCVWKGLIVFGIFVALVIFGEVARLRARMSAREVTTVHGARDIVQAEAQFFKDHNRYASPEELVEADLLEVHWRECAPSCSVSGYSWEFRMTEQSFEALAVPLQYSRTGVRSFYVSEAGVIRAADKDGYEANATDPPLQ